nr:hypothetical protein [Tanacetum cinerariifolium]
ARGPSYPMELGRLDGWWKAAETKSEFGST